MNRPHVIPLLQGEIAVPENTQDFVRSALDKALAGKYTDARWLLLGACDHSKREHVAALFHGECNRRGVNRDDAPQLEAALAALEEMPALAFLFAQREATKPSNAA